MTIGGQKFGVFTRRKRKARGTGLRQMAKKIGPSMTDCERVVVRRRRGGYWAWRLESGVFVLQTFCAVKNSAGKFTRNSWMGDESRSNKMEDKHLGKLAKVDLHERGEGETKNFIPWRALGVGMLLGHFLLVFLLFSSPVAFAQSSCEAEEQLYKETPRDYENYTDHVKTGYARCLLANERGERRPEALRILQGVARQSNNVYAAFLIACDVLRNGDYKKHLREIIEDHKLVKFFIGLDHGYPNPRYSMYERKYDIELKTHFVLVALHLEKYALGREGHKNEISMLSPSYDGDQNLETYPEYSPYVIDSLKKTIHFAKICLALSRKQYWNEKAFTAAKGNCEYIKNFSEKVLPLELEKKETLNQSFCEDPLMCPEYQNILVKINALEVDFSLPIDYQFPTPF